MRRAALALALGLLLAAAPTSASGAGNPCTDGPETQELIPTSNIPGVLGLHFRTAQGAPVSFYECVGGQPQLLGRVTTPDFTTELDPATWWRCDRLVRRFAATATLPDGTPARGTAAIRTMSCAHRFALRAPARVATGATARIRVYDRWSQGGIRTRLCVTPPRGPARCRHLTFPVSVNVVARSLTLEQPGDWRVAVKTPRAVLRATIAVGAHAPVHTTRLPAVLATGDSTMLGTESFLADDLAGRADVVSDVHPGTSISLTNEWSRLSPGQARRFRPRVTVLSIGANEGYPMRSPAGAELACCDAAWSDEYRRRLTGSLRDYLRRGQAHVLLLAQPLPRDPDRTPIHAAVNAAILRAAAELDRVAALRLDTVFTPHGYRDVMRYRGRRVRVRLPDGVHLSVAGTAIAARLIAQDLRRRCWVRPARTRCRPQPARAAPPRPS